MNDGWRSHRWIGAPFLLFVLLAATFALVREPRAAGLALTTLQLVAWTVAWSVPIGTFLAILIARTDLPARRAFIAAWCLLLFLPLYVQASAWDAGFGQQGWFTLRFGDPRWPWLTRMPAAIWIHALAAVPWIMLIVGQGLRQVESELEEVALLDANPLTVLLRVTLPRAMPAILASALVVTVLTAGEMTVTDIYRVRTYAEELYTNAALTADAVDLGISIWPHVAILCVLVTLAWQAALVLAPINDRTVVGRLWSIPLSSLRWLAFAAVLVTTLFAVGVPLANLVYKAGLVMDSSSGTPVQAWSWDRFTSSTLPLQANPLAWRFAKEYQATLMLGCLVGTAGAVLAVPLALAARLGGRMAAGIFALLGVGIALPGPLTALAVIWLLNRPTPALLPWLYDETLFAPTLAIVVRTLPITTLIVWGAFRSVDQDQVDAACADGASWFELLRNVLLPQRWSAILIAWLAGFAIAAGDLSSSLLVIPPGQTTIANQIFLLVHAGVHNAEAGLCLGQTLFFGVLSGAVLWLLQSVPTIES